MPRKVKQVFECLYCFTTFDNKPEADECASSHLDQIEVNNAYGYELGKDVPKYLEVITKTGKHIYQLVDS